MTGNGAPETCDGWATSRDGTRLIYHTLGRGPGLVVVGGVLSTGLDYLPLAHELAGGFEVHLLERRGRGGSGPHRAGHSIADECDDLVAVLQATSASAVFGHSFGGLVALETACRSVDVTELFLYEPGVPLRGQLRSDWLGDYERLLQQGDRRGAFASMVKGAGFAPKPLTAMPLRYVKLLLRLALRGQKWASMNELLEANLIEHRAQALVDAPTAERFSKVGARTLLLGAAASPDFVSGKLLPELAEAIPDCAVELLPRGGHLAPIERPESIAELILARHAGAATRSAG